MNGAELRDWRVSQELSQRELAEMLNAALDRHYNEASISRWEQEKRPIPQYVLDHLLGVSHSPSSQEEETLHPPSEQGADGRTFTGEDIPPVPSAPTIPLRVIPGAGGTYQKLCTDLFEQIGAAVEFGGTLSNSIVIVYDGQIIRGDAKTLGTAWGNVCDHSPGARKIVDALAAGGPWPMAIIATVQTTNKVVSNHRQYALHVREQVADADADGQPPAA